MAMTAEKKRQRKERQEMLGRLVDEFTVKQATAAVDILGKMNVGPSEKALRRMSQHQREEEVKRIKGILLDRNMMRLTRRQIVALSKGRAKQVLQQSKDQAAQNREIEEQGEELALQQISRELPSLPTDTALDG